MRPVVGGLMVLFLVPLSAQLQPSTPETAIDEISRLLSQPGVYLDSLTATPRLVRVNPVVAKEIDVRVKRDEEPVVAQYPCARAPVRSASIEPVFYLYKNRPEMFYSSKGKLDVWLVTLEPQADNRRLRLGTAKPAPRGGSQ